MEAIEMMHQAVYDFPAWALLLVACGAFAVLAIMGVVSGYKARKKQKAAPPTPAEPVRLPDSGAAYYIELLLSDVDPSEVVEWAGRISSRLVGRGFGCMITDDRTRMQLWPYKGACTKLIYRRGGGVVFEVAAKDSGCAAITPKDIRVAKDSGCDTLIVCVSTVKDGVWLTAKPPAR